MTHTRKTLEEHGRIQLTFARRDKEEIKRLVNMLDLPAATLLKTVIGKELGLPYNKIIYKEIMKRNKTKGE